MVIGSKLRELRRKQKLSQAELAKQAGVARSYISLLEHNNRGVKLETLEKILTALGSSLEGFFSGLSALRYGPIPVISWIQAGEFKEAIDAWPVGVSGEAEPVYTDVKVSQYAFGLRVVGDSMEPRFLEGDIIIVDPEIRPQTGDYCVAWLSGEVTFKKLQEKQDEILLVPLNEKHAELKISKNRKVDFKLIGKVVDMKPKIY